jgi:hypothetical protein
MSAATPVSKVDSMTGANNGEWFGWQAACDPLDVLQPLCLCERRWVSAAQEPGMHERDLSTVAIRRTEQCWHTPGLSAPARVARPYRRAAARLALAVSQDTDHPGTVDTGRRVIPQHPQPLGPVNSLAFFVLYGAQYLTAQYLQLVVGLSPLAEMHPPQPPEQIRQVSDAIRRAST